MPNKSGPSPIISSNTEVPGPGNGPDDKAHKAGLIPVVGIGASAGGLDAVKRLLQHLPGSTGMGFVLVQHLDPHHTSALAGLLDGHTSMPVSQAIDKTSVLPNRVYVIPPNAQMAIQAGMLRLTPRSGNEHERHLPIDYFFKSLAVDRRDRAIGVILSGGASDGTMGLEAIKGEGGITFAQDASAKFDSMPRSAIAAGVVDFVLPPEAIARELGVIALSAYFGSVTTEFLVKDGPAMERIVSLLRERVGVDFTHYKAPTIHRRLARRLAVHHLNSLEAYRAFLEETPAEINALFDDVLITVTDFFRDPEMFEALSDVALPQMVKNRNPNDPIECGCRAALRARKSIQLQFALLST